MLTEAQVKAIYQERWGRDPDAAEIAEGILQSREDLYASLARRNEDLAPTEGQTDVDVSDDVYRMINRDRGSWEQQLKEAAAAAGVSYHSSDLDGVVRAVRSNPGSDPQQFINNAANTYAERAQPGGGEPAPAPTPAPTPAPATAPATAAPSSAAPYGWGTQYGVGPYGGPQSLMGPWTGVAPPVPQMGASSWDPYAAPAPYEPPSAYQPGEYQPPTYTPGAPFTGPTAEQMSADPGYQFRLQQGQEALERSGAARGVTNTGGTLKNILDYGQQAASQEYGNVYDRAAQNWGMNEAARQASFGLNAPEQFQGWAATEAGRLGTYQMGEAHRAGAYGMNEANRATAAQFNQVGYQQAYQNEAQRRQQEYANRYQNWSSQYNQWRQQGADRFTEQWMLANA